MLGTMKLAIVVDSSCGLTKAQATQRGWHFLPLMITIDGKEYADGIDLTAQSFAKIYRSDSVASTSFTPIGYTIELLQKLANENDFVVVYPISQYLSSQMENLEVIAKDYTNVLVVKSKRVAQLIVKDLVELEASVLANELTVRQAVERIESQNYHVPEILLIPETMNALVKGGRLSPSAAKMAKLLKIVPVIAFQDGKLEKYTKGRIFFKVVVNAAVTLYHKLHGRDRHLTMMFLDMQNSNADNLFLQIRTELEYSDPPIRFAIPPVIAIHTGFGAVCVFITKLERDVKDYQFDKIS